jgi:hypothetical protein
MKTARFAAVVEAAGKRIRTCSSCRPKRTRPYSRSGTRDDGASEVVEAVDHGTVGFVPGRARQLLIFPKSIFKFNGMYCWINPIC